MGNSRLESIEAGATRNKSYKTTTDRTGFRDCPLADDTLTVSGFHLGNIACLRGIPYRGTFAFDRKKCSRWNRSGWCFERNKRNRCCSCVWAVSRRIIRGGGRNVRKEPAVIRSNSEGFKGRDRNSGPPLALELHCGGATPSVCPTTWPFIWCRHFNSSSVD